MRKYKITDQYLKWVGILLRLYLGYSFFYHGMRALFIEEAWIPMFTAVGLTTEMATILMPIIGVVDICVALILLVRPAKYVAVWAGLWPIVPSVGAYMVGHSSIIHEFWHVVPPLVAGSVLFYILDKKGIQDNSRNVRL